MSTDARTVAGILTTGLAAGLATVAAHAGWTFWPGFLAIPLIFIAVVLARGPSGRPALSAPGLGSYSDGIFGNPDASLAGPPISVVLPGVEHECTLPRMLVHSAVDGYDFRFSATVRWRESANVPQVVHNDLAAVARAAIVRRAADVLAVREPGEVALAEVELAGALGARLPDAAGMLEAWAGDVTLTLSDADKERMRRLAEIRKDEEVWEQEREYEKQRRAYLGDDVLKSGGSAVVWALSRKEDAIERAVSLIGPLALLSAAANDTDVAPVFRRLAPPQYQEREEPEPYEAYEAPEFEPAPGSAPRTTRDYVDEFADHLGFPPDLDLRGYFVSNFAAFLRAVDRKEEADNLQRILRVVRDDNPEPGESLPDPDPDPDPGSDPDPYDYDPYEP